MGETDFLTPLHVEVARLFFGLKSSDGYLVARGAGLLASELIARSTEDIDLFASTPITTVVEAKLEFVDLLEQRFAAGLPDTDACFRMGARESRDDLPESLTGDGFHHSRGDTFSARRSRRPAMILVRVRPSVSALSIRIGPRHPHR